MRIGNKLVIADDNLSGNTNAYTNGNIIFCSPAIVECLSDPSIRDIVMQQVKVKPLSELIDSELNEMECR